MLDGVFHAMLAWLLLDADTRFNLPGFFFFSVHVSKDLKEPYVKF